MSTRGGKRSGAGRKKGSVNKTTVEIRALAQNYGEAAVLALAKLGGLVTDEAGATIGAAVSEQVKKAALDSLIERGYGKSPQAIIGDPENPVHVKVNRIELVIVDPKA